MRTPFGAIIHTEVLFNSKRVAPYALMLVFSANAALWCLAGPAASRGWITNSDFYIARLFVGFSFMTMPLFIALIMGDPVIRDYRTRIDPLIFSKPVTSGEYLLGKFFGNFFVLVCCLGCFAATACLLQAFSGSGSIGLSIRVVPYLTLFFFFVVVSSLTIAAICFTVGTLTRNVKVVYGLVTSGYLLYISAQIAMKGLPLRWRIILDPLLFNWESLYRDRDAAFINQLSVSLSGDMIANRLLMLLASAICLGFLYYRFSMVERATKPRDSRLTTFDLGTKPERLYDERGATALTLPTSAAIEIVPKPVTLPVVTATTQRPGASLRQLRAATAIELRLLYAERSLVVLVPIAMLLSFAGLGYYQVVPDGSYSATYAARTADSLLLFLFAIAVFYTGEAMHRDRDLRIEPVLWSAPTPNFVLLLSKFSATLILSLSLSVMACATAVVTQLLRGHTPIQLLSYVSVATVILIPNMIFMIASSTALNVLLRDKYLAYAACLGIGGGLYYLFSAGYNRPSYNPVLYDLWRPSDLAFGAPHLPQILTHRVYCLALTMVFLSLSHLFFGRGSGNLTGRWKRNRSSIIILALTTVAAVITGLLTEAAR